MKTTERFGFTTYNSPTDAKAKNSDITNAYEANFNILDKSACKIVNIPLTVGAEGTYTTDVAWSDIEDGINKKALILADLDGSLLPLMVCDKSNGGYSLLFGYTNILTDSVVTRSISCVYTVADNEMVWTDFDGELELGPQAPTITEEDEGKVLVVKDGSIKFVYITELVKTELQIADSGKSKVVYYN